MATERDTGRRALATRQFESNPFSTMRRMLQDMDRFFQPSGTSRSYGTQELWAPQVELFQKNGELVVRADLPGLKESDLDIQIEQNTLILKGERRHEHEQEEGGYYRSEMVYGSFYRAIPLPEGVDPEKCRATFDKGVLEVCLTLPQRELPQAKKIEVKPRTEESGKKQKAH